MLAGVAWWIWLAGCFAGDAPPAPQPERLPGSRGAAQEPAPEGRDRPGKAGRRDAPAGREPSGPLPEVADPCAARDEPGFFTFTLPGHDLATETWVFVPKTAGPHRMAVLLHGGDGDAASIVRQTGFLRIAAQEGIVVVAPNGYGGATPGKESWNHRDMPGMERDDVAYLDAVTRAVAERTCGKQVLAVGFSGGSMMANRWLCEGKAPDAALTAAGRIGVDTTKCRGPRPHRSYVGTDDDHYRTGDPTTAKTMDLWGRINRCEGPARETVEGRVTRRVWSGCAAATEQVVIAGFPHAWPRAGGNVEAPVDATAEGWAWFEGTVR